MKIVRFYNAMVNVNGHVFDASLFAIAAFIGASIDVPPTEWAIVASVILLTWLVLWVFQELIEPMIKNEPDHI